MGAQMGAFLGFTMNKLFVLNVLHRNLSPAFAPKDANISRLRAAFFVSGIQYMQGFPHFFIQLVPTLFNLHQLTDVGTTAGISRFDIVCTHTEPLKGYSL